MKCVIVSKHSSFNFFVSSWRQRLFSEPVVVLFIWIYKFLRATRKNKMQTTFFIVNPLYWLWFPKNPNSIFISIVCIVFTYKDKSGADKDSSYEKRLLLLVDFKETKFLFQIQKCSYLKYIWFSFKYIFYAVKFLRYHYIVFFFFYIRRIHN